MQGFLKKAAAEVQAASDKAADAAESKIGASGAEQVKKYGHEAADKIAAMNADQLQTQLQTGVEGQLKSHGINLPAGMSIPGMGNATTASKAAVPTSANATTGGVVTKVPGAVPAAGEGNPVTEAKPAEATPAAPAEPAATQ